MSRLRCFVVVLAVAGISVGARADTHPDFSGTWTVDRVDVQDQPKENGSPVRFGGFGGGGRGGRGGYGRGGGGYGRGGAGGGGGRRQGAGRRGATGLSQGDTLHVSQTTERLIVTRATPDGDVMSRYSLDGKETKNHPSPEVEVKSKTKWDGATLVTDSTQTTDTGQGKTSTKSREVLSLSEDGQTLTSTMTADSRFGKRTIVATLSRATRQ